MSDQAEPGSGLGPTLVAGLLAVGLLSLVAVFLLFGGGGSYRVTAEFSNASQLVEGNEVLVSGEKAGSIRSIELGDDNVALVELELHERFAPLRRGVVARARSRSFSGVANRYVELGLPGEGEAGDVIEDGGVLSLDETVARVDLDQLFGTLDEETREDLQKFVRGLRGLSEGVGRESNRALRFAAPFASQVRLTAGELNRDEEQLERFLVETSRFVSAVAERRDDLAGLIRNLRGVVGALASEAEALGVSVEELPGFMRRANTTFVNLRAALDDVAPLVEASRPSARQLAEFLPELRAFAEGAGPTVRRLSRVVRRPGRANDLIDLQRLQPAVARAALGPVEVRGVERRGAFPEQVESLRGSLPNLAHFRPYTSELVGWFDGFGHTGKYDANGGMAPIGTVLNAFTLQAPNIPLLDQFIPPADRASLLEQLLPGSIQNTRRCPGANERDRDGSTPFTDGGTLNCDPTQMPVGP